MKDHKLYEFTVNENGIRFRRTNPNPMSAEQKHNIIKALLALSAGGLYSAVLISVVKVCGILGLLVMLPATVLAILAAQEI